QTASDSSAPTVPASTCPAWAKPDSPVGTTAPTRPSTTRPTTALIDASSRPRASNRDANTLYSKVAASRRCMDSLSNRESCSPEQHREQAIVPLFSPPFVRSARLFLPGKKESKPASGPLLSDSAAPLHFRTRGAPPRKELICRHRPVWPGIRSIRSSWLFP